MAALRLSTITVRVRTTPLASPGTRNSVMPCGSSRLPAVRAATDQQIGDVPVEDEALLAVEPPALAALARRRGDAEGRVVRAFFERERDEALAADQRGQVCALLRGAAGQRQGAGADQRRRHERRRRQAAPGGFQNLAQADAAEIGAAILLAREETGPAQRRHLAP